MPRTVYYPRWKRLTMQAVMIAILLGTVGLAAVVDRRLAAAQQQLLASPIVDGPVSFSLPSGWKVASRAADHTWVASAPPDSVDGVRTVTVSLQRVDRLMPPIEYLALSGRLTSTNLEDLSIKSANFDGFPAQTMTTVKNMANMDEDDESVRYLACCVLPTRQAFTFTYEKTGPVDKGDGRLIKLLLENIHVTALPEALRVSTGNVTLSNGITVTAPPDFQILPETDPLHNDCAMVSSSGYGKWISCDVIPVTLPVDGKLGFATQALASREFDPQDIPRGRGWLEAKTVQLSPGHWRILPKDVESLIKRRAFLVGTPGGPGALIVVHTVYPAGDEELESVWSSLSDSIQINQQPNLSGLLDAGAEFAQTPSRLPASADRYFLGKRNNVPEEWIHDYADPQGVTPVRETWSKSWPGTLEHVAQRWSTGQTAWANALREYAGADPSASYVVVMQTNTRLDANITTVLDVPGLRLPSIVPRSPAYVLSARLPDLLASAPAGPIAIWTDRAPSMPEALLSEPVLLIISRQADYVQVEVNGSGELSRWYYKDGNLDHADLPGGLTLRPSTAREIKASFTDPRLTEGL